MSNKAKSNSLRLLLTALLLVFGTGTTAFGSTPFDVNGGGQEGLAETIHSLQVVAGLDPATVPYTFTNAIGMTFKLLPAGDFMMGSLSTEPGSEDDEQPQHQVTLSKSFYMQTTEVTRDQ